MPHSRLARAAQTSLLTLLAAGGLGVGNELTSGGNRRGFVVGLGDHIPLAPYGIVRVDPEAFAGDWYSREAPNPHWSFELVVMAGRAAGQLPVALLLYYLLALLAFGWATAMLARRWSRGSLPLAAAASLAVGLLSAYQAIYLAGTNTMNSPLALPNVLGGALGYLYLAALLARRPWAPTVLPVVAIAHVQVGALALGVAVLALLVLAWPVRRRWRAVRRALVFGAACWLSAALLVLGALKARPVASDPGSFVEICTTYIGFHCAAQQWPRFQILSTVGAVLLCLCLAVLPRGRDRWLYAVTVCLPALGLVVAMLLDRRGVPVLGRLVQAYNAYRVGNLIFPFAVWGVLAPLLPRVVRGPRDRGGVRALARRVALLGVALAAPLGTVFFYTSPGVKTRFAEDASFTPMARVAGVVLVTLAVAAWAVLPGWGWRPGVTADAGDDRADGAGRAGQVDGADQAEQADRTRRADRRADRRAARRAPANPRWVAGVAALTILTVCGLGLVAVRASGFTGARPVPLAWVASPAETLWGKQARELIRPGGQVLIPPTMPQLKLAMERGVVVDCKDLPYGGPAYAEWQQRLAAIGGTQQCEGYTPGAFAGLTAAQLDAAARRYGAAAIVLPHEEGSSRVAALVALGYTAHRVRGGTTPTDTDILVR